MQLGLETTGLQIPRAEHISMNDLRPVNFHKCLRLSTPSALKLLKVCPSYVLACSQGYHAFNTLTSVSSYWGSCEAHASHDGLMGGNV